MERTTLLPFQINPVIAGRYPTPPEILNSALKQLIVKGRVMSIATTTFM